MSIYVDEIKRRITNVMRNDLTLVDTNVLLTLAIHEDLAGIEKTLKFMLGVEPEIVPPEEVEEFFNKLGEEYEQNNGEEATKEN